MLHRLKQLVYVSAVSPIVLCPSVARQPLVVREPPAVTLRDCGAGRKASFVAALPSRVLAGSNDK